MKNSKDLNKINKTGVKAESLTLNNGINHRTAHLKMNRLILFLMVFGILLVSACASTHTARKHVDKHHHGGSSYEHFNAPGQY